MDVADHARGSRTRRAIQMQSSERQRNQQKLGSPCGSFKKVRQVCDGGFRRLAMYFATVASESSNPEFQKFPWIRGAPQRGFARLIFRIRSRISNDTAGRPSGCRLFQVQYNRKPFRCQAITVSGFTMIKADCQPLQSRESQTQQTRSQAFIRTRRPRILALEDDELMAQGDNLSLKGEARSKQRRRAANRERIKVIMARAEYLR